MTAYLIGLDFGTASARGVLVDAETGAEIAAHAVDYPHGTLTRALPDGTPLARGWALQVAEDYTQVTAEILTRLGQGRQVLGIGLGFTASSPLPCTDEGVALSTLTPGDPHAYVKLWKHGAAQAQADRINAKGGTWLRRFGGKLSAEWLIPKAAQIAEEAPATWSRTARFIEAGDWLVWQLTGVEARSLGLAAYKAQWDPEAGYPEVLPGLTERLAPPVPVGSRAGELSADWQSRTGIQGPCAVAVAVIDSHVVLPAIGAVTGQTFVAALGTSAVSMMLSEAEHPLPKGIEGTAHDGSMRGLWCYEAGQASFGDTLAWAAGLSPEAGGFDALNAAAGRMRPGESGLLALDWWNGNRVPLANSALSGVILGLRAETSPQAIYRALMEALCFGMAQVFDLYLEGGFAIDRVVMTSGLAERNPVLVQIMADILGREIEVPQIAHATARGAAIHGAVAAGLVDFAEGARRYGAQGCRLHCPSPAPAYARLLAQYKALTRNATLRAALLDLDRLAAATRTETEQPIRAVAE